MLFLRKARFIGVLISLVILLVLLKLGTVNVSAGNEACGGSTPVCWPSRSVDQWACEVCTQTKWVCGGNNSISCDPNGNVGATCGNYGGGPCVNLCFDTSYVGKCSVLNKPVSCNNTGPGHCSWDGSLQDCVWSGGTCTNSTAQSSLGCCGPGSVTATPTSGPGPTSPPPPTATPTSPPQPTVVPNCSDVSANPSVLDLGQSTTLFAKYFSTQGNLAGEIFEGTPPSTINSLIYQTLPGTFGTISYSWTPAAAGTYQVCCRAWNDKIAECRPSSYVDGPPRFPCVGPTVCTDVTVNAAAPTCTVSGSNINLAVGQSTIPAYTPIVVPNPGSIQKSLTVSVSDPTVASVCDGNSPLPCPPGQASFTDDTAAFNVKITALKVGTTSLSILAAVSDASGTTFATCPNTVPTVVTVTNLPAWWQVIGGGAVSETGTINSQIPSTTFCNGTCSPYLIIPSANSTVGAASLGGSSYNLGSGSVSTNGWIAASSNYAGNTPTFTFFSDKINNLGLSLTSLPFSYDVASFNTMAANYQGYKVAMYDGSLYGGQPLALTNSGGALSSGTKVVLLVKNAGVNINSPITLTKGQSSFVLISQGDVTVASAVTQLEGMLFIGGTLHTPSLGPSQDSQLHVRGSVITITGVDLKRDLTNNTNSPAELFEYAPDQLLMFPPFISLKNVNWKEIAP